MTRLQFNTALLDLHDKLYFYAYNLTSDKEKARDLLQETFLKALSYRNMFSPNTNFRAWIYTIMRNTFINEYRRNEKAKQTFKDSKADFLLKFVNQGSCASPESVCISDEILKCVNLLDPEYKVPFKMFLDGYKYKEIAEAVGIPLGTVKSRIFFARKKLEKWLQEYTSNRNSYYSDR